MKWWCGVVVWGVGVWGVVVWGVVVWSVVAVCFVGGAQGRNSGKKTPKVCEVTAKELEQTPFNASCPGRGLIASISVVGHHGDHCRGLTPDLFVQMNSCFWKQECTLTYNATARNFLLKLYQGTMAQCVTSQPQKFAISHHCTTRKVKGLHIVRKRREGREKPVKDRQGVIISHSDHPWLYRRHDSLQEQLTLRNPRSKKLKYFWYTIRTLSLMTGDTLTFNWTTVKGVRGSVTFDADHVVGGGSGRVGDSIAGARTVQIGLHTQPYSTGEEGFLVCFRWSKKMSTGDACKRLLVQRPCKRKKNKKRPKKKGSKGGKSQNANSVDEQ